MRPNRRVRFLVLVLSIGLDTHHEAVQYGQYNKWMQASNDSPMVMTSAMLYLDRLAEAEIEVSEYSETQVSNQCPYMEIWKSGEYFTGNFPSSFLISVEQLD